MKVAIITANIGQFDTIRGIPKQSMEADFYCYDETNLPFPLANLNNRMKARYLKCNAHRFLPGYDAYIWIDGRIEVTGNSFVETIMEQLVDHDLVVYKHYERENIDQELDFILSHIRKGTPYIFSRYGNQQIEKEKALYKSEGIINDSDKPLALHLPLVIGGVFARLNSEKVNAAFDEWWNRIVEFSCSDQTMLSYIIWKQNLKANYLTYDLDRTSKLFQIGRHIK